MQKQNRFLIAILFHNTTYLFSFFFTNLALSKLKLILKQGNQQLP